MRVLVVLLLALALAPPAAAFDRVPGRVVVGFSAGASAASRDASRDAAHGRLVRRLSLGRGAVQVLDVGRGRVRAAVRALARRRGVRFAEPDYLGHIAVTPNDPDYASRQWNLAQIGMPDAWETTTGSAAVKVAVLDTGVDLDHPDLDDQLDKADGYDLIDGDAAPDDPNGHGTHVAGIAGARGGDGFGIAGVSWSSSLIALRVCGTTGSCPTSAIADGLARAAAARAKVANVSIEAPFSSAVKKAIDDAQGMLVVAAAGNAGTDVDTTPSYPCAYPEANVVCVASTKTDDTLMKSSNYGAMSVDLAAPGSVIWSTLPGGYGYDSGTSMAAPHVAGAAALLWTSAPGATSADVRSALLGTVDPRGLPVASGGRLNVAAALASLLGVVIDGPAYGSASPATSIPFHATSNGTGFTCRVDDAPSFTPCSSPYDVSGLVDGQHTLRVRTVPGGITVARTWTVDRTAPVVHASATGAPPLRRSPVTFSVDDTAAVTACSLDHAAFAPCTSPWTPSAPLADGRHTLGVRAVDAAGNVGTDTAEWKLLAAPLTTFTDTPSVLTRQTSATFAFTADGATGYRCSLDDKPFGLCTSGLTLADLADGSHEFRVGATANGFADDQEWSAFRWTVDTVAPAVSITGGPSGTVASRSASVPFTVGEGLAARCALDGAAASACSSPFTASGLADGPHTVSVSAADAAGNTGVATRSWTVDGTAPAVAIDGVTTSEGSAAVAFHADDGALTTCALDGAGFAPCTSPATYDGLADGRHAFEVRAADALGNRASAMVGFDVRRTPGPTPTPTVSATATPTPASVVRAASPAAVARAVAKRLTKRTPAALARLKPFRVGYRAALGGRLEVTVRVAGIGTVLRGRSDTTAPRTLRPAVRRTKAAARLARRSRATLTVLARFTPVRGNVVRATRHVIVRR